ncbi:MAG TPA: DUF6364 family protein [Candidatus Polarisedimenticolia bacterium]|jgi:hypothetical protein|nr:DUF6364 family protein [Candidatus Polarisedimenticolia bacterium]
MAKLTLNVDERVVARAKRYASRRGTSVSRLVVPALVVLARLRDELKGSAADPAAYRRHLERKHSR